MSGIYWLASYPKSGNTWLRVLLTNYLKNEVEPANINNLSVTGRAFLQSHFEDILGIDANDLSKNQINHYRPRVYEKMAAEFPAPLFLKIHDAFIYNNDGQPIVSARATAGAIYIVRNPLDVAVSYAHHRDESIDETIEHMNHSEAFLAGTEKLEGQLPQKLKSWSENVRSWTEAVEIEVHIVRYEDLLQEPIKIFADLIRFTKIPFDLDKIKKAVSFSSFEQLKKQELIHGFIEKQPTSKSFFRKGTVESWREQLTDVQARKIIDSHYDVMRKFGYLNAEFGFPL